MKTTQLHYQSGKWNKIPTTNEADPSKTQLVLVFGAGIVVSDGQVYAHVKKLFPQADIISCSTSGEILADNVYDDTAVVTAIELEKSTVKSVLQKVSSGVNSYETGKSIMQQLNAENLATILVISEGSFINGSELVNGLNEVNVNEVPITGGLAGDAARFEKTQVGLNAPATEGNVVAIGFYGHTLQIGHSSFGGWDEFGKERVITKSDKNVLYEIDGESALDLYKQYLGPYVEELPGSALLFPLSMRTNDSGTNLVRTILTIDEEKKTMTFAGNLPEGSRVRLMKANFEKIIEGSSIAASKSVERGEKQHPDLALLISCVGRKLILQDRTAEEVQAARNIFGEATSITGFYSYGEISPFNPHTNCELHNQTMTITTFSEA
ncbi:MAG: FIST C-terminal domain-containing protein [Chitinophagaceae bacterium]|nr:FIST C-terminal domain-containing protein [Chitinophagaceae bacterium]